MLSLIYKDFLLQRGSKSLIYMLVMPVISSFAFSGELLYAILPFIAGSYLYIVYANALDDKFKAEKMLLAMPIQRKTIIGSKYAGVFIYMIAFLAATAILTRLINIIVPGFIPARGLRWPQIVQFMTIFSVYYGVFFPIYFRVGYQKSRWANYLSLLAAAGLFVFLTKGLSEISGVYIESLQAALEYLTGFRAWFWNGVLPLMSAVIIGGSMYLSMIFYRKREF